MDVHWSSDNNVRAVLLQDFFTIFLLGDSSETSDLSNFLLKNFEELMLTLIVGKYLENLSNSIFICSVSTRDEHSTSTDATPSVGIRSWRVEMMNAVDFPFLESPWQRTSNPRIASGMHLNWAEKWNISYIFISIHIRYTKSQYSVFRTNNF